MRSADHAIQRGRGPADGFLLVDALHRAVDGAVLLRHDHERCAEVRAALHVFAATDGAERSDHAWAATFVHRFFVRNAADDALREKFARIRHSGWE